ncbi:GntR family transcriptional regulator [Actinosynnema sp. NPDC020468]|uniref:GntR family transcriptional regulator n=1 Tax=Actinosynnema sp. NPDC020468 TaxID=3154488 RepID=UPI0033E6AAA8
MSRTKHGLPPTTAMPAELAVGRPKGGQLREFLEALVNELGPGVLLPSERVLAERYGVARMTVRQELDRLAADGVVVRRPRHGTFVAELKVAQVDLVTSFSDYARQKGMIPGARVVSTVVEPATPRLADQLEVRPGSPLLRLVRLRTADGVPMALERTHLSVDRFPGIGELEWENRSLYRELAQRWNVRIASTRARISAVLPEPEEAKVLDIPRNQPCFVIEGIPRDPEGVVVETGRSIYRADRYEVITHVQH